jgi:hypothetical protein
MSQQLINRSFDLKQLQDEGYDIEIRSNYLLLKNIPYVNSRAEIDYGVLVSELTLAGNITTTPSTHVVMFSGEYPCNKDGTPIEQIRNTSNRQVLGENLVIEHAFSSKPVGGYVNYYDKMTTYIRIIASPAISINHEVTARTYPVISPEIEQDSVFNYIDTASSRAGISAISEKLKISKVAIVGMGGTGSYVLDLIAKTEVKEIHLFDGDRFLQHNAFRSPGAASREELGLKAHKATYFQEVYSKMRKGIFAHNFFIDDSNIDELHDMGFVFLCVDNNIVKKLIVEKLESFGISFIDTGVGVYEVEGSLHGMLRITTSTPEQRSHVSERNRIPFLEGIDGNEYSRNIQIADLNALNAALAVVKWKKLFGFYQDLESEYFSVYTVDGNSIINEDQNEAYKKA